MEQASFMQRAIELARNGWPKALPNPLVGCVIVRGETIVAEGWHDYFGGPHAEVVAVNNLPDNIDPAECSVYVTLEPCTHFGKTPPCADLLISKGFREALIGSQDPNPVVRGKGIEKLKAAGIAVTSGLLEKECRELNRIFFTFHEKRRPYIILKWAISADGFLGPGKTGAGNPSKQITRSAANHMVHELRARCQAIMVGTNTAIHDDPLLTTRLVKGPNPVRVVIDRQLSIPPQARIFGNESQTIIVNEKRAEDKDHLTWLKLDFAKPVLQPLLAELHRRQLQTVLVEGGAETLRNFIDQGLWDEAFIFENPELRLGQGVKGPVFPLKNSFELVGEDKLYHHFRDEAMPAKGPLSKEIF